MTRTNRWRAIAAATALAVALPCLGAQAKTLSVVYVQGQTGNPFFTSVTCGAMDEAKKLGVEFSAQGGQQYSPTSQTPVLNAVIARHPDGIMISPMVGPAMVAPLMQAKDAGIKIVYVDTAAADASLALSFVASDNEAGGRLAAEKLADLLGGKGVVMLESSIPGISSTDARNKGFEAEIKKHPGIRYVGVQFSQGDPAKATSQISSMLAAHPDLNGIFAVSTQEVEGAAAALSQSGKQGIKVVGFDTAPPILTDIEQGIIQGVVVQEPMTMGATALQQLVDGLNGKPTTPVIHTPFVFLTKANMKDPSISQFIYKTSCSP